MLIWFSLMLMISATLFTALSFEGTMEVTNVDL